MTDKEKLARLIEYIKNTVPYITATLGPGCTFDIKELMGVAEPRKTGDWFAVHRGRAGVSYANLSHLLMLAKEFEND